MNSFGIFGVLAGSAVALALFLSSFFLGIKRKEDPKHLWVGLILLAIGLRVGKSIFYFLLNDMAPIGLAVGFLGLASIGPLSWFLVSGASSIHKKNGGHFVIPISGAIACFMVAPSPWETYLYESATAVLLVYLGCSWISFFRNESTNSWSRSVLIVVSGVWIALVYQHMSNTMMDYAIGAVIAAVFIYWLFFQSFKTGALSKGIEVSLPDQTLEKVREAFEQQAIFRQSGMNLQQFASDLNMPSYLITRSVKELYGKTFPETLNYFRIEKIKEMLLDPKKEHLKIEALAYEVGYTTPSAFYAAFKKSTGQTPTAYQKKASLISA
ncbi:MAG: helix-turn-helix domain-containing protein [Cytophagales bacterium]|nr:helix-turn-helix domain-containing protein [Cytophagales bacterium]